MMHSSLDETKRKVHHLTEQIKTDSWEGVENSLLELILEIQKGQLELANTTPRNSDLALIIQEMKAGFARQDQRFDDLIHQMDRRFEQVDRRFEQMERNFKFLQWFFGAWLTIIGTVLTYGTFFK